jgi:hypothetical protein
MLPRMARKSMVSSFSFLLDPDYRLLKRMFTSRRLFNFADEFFPGQNDSDKHVLCSGATRFMECTASTKTLLPSLFRGRKNRPLMRKVFGSISPLTRADTVHNFLLYQLLFACFGSQTKFNVKCRNHGHN